VVGALSATVEVTSLNTPLRDVAPQVTSPPPTVPDTGQVIQAVPEEAALLASTFEASHKRKGKGKVSD